MSLTDKPAATDGELQFPGMRKKRKGKLVLVLALVCAGGAWWYWQQSQQQEETEAPLLATVETGSIENTIASAGTLKPSRFIDVGAQVNGILQKLHVKVGDTVEQGQLLAEIDARLQQARVEASRASIAAQEAQIEAREAQLVLAKANAARQERLMADNATSQLEYDNAVNNLAAAEASLTQLQRQITQSSATLRTEETQLEFTRIFAPASGTVVTIEMNEGRTLNVNQQAPIILRIADLTVMTVEADISEADIGNIRAGMDVYFTTLGGGNRRWYAKVRQILPTPEVLNNVVLYTGLFDIENPDGALLSEMTAQVYFITSSAQDVLTVPVGALTFLDRQAAPAGGRPAGAGPGGGAGGGQRAAPVAGRGQAGPRPATVTVVKPDGSTEERNVMVGVTSRVDAEVLSGLQEGEQVIAGILESTNSAPAAQGGPNVRIGGFGGGFRR